MQTKTALEKYCKNCVFGVLIFEIRIIIIQYIVNIPSKSNDKDNSIYSRLPEREDPAESLLARIECLPPLNFSGERFLEVSNL
jgi:hypothetical protein